MKRLCSKYDFKGYTLLKQVLYDLELSNQPYLWLISDIEAYPRKSELCELLDQNDYLLLETSQLVQMLEIDDFQWVWGVFSAIPATYDRGKVLQFDLPYVRDVQVGMYNPYTDQPKLQHPYAALELYAVDSSYLFMVTDNDDFVARFKQKYPKYIEE